MRLGLRNKLQTKRDGQVEDLLDWAVITDWRLDPRENQGHFSDIYSEADFKPRRWLTLNSEMRVIPRPPCSANPIARPSSSPGAIGRSRSRTGTPGRPGSGPGRRPPRHPALPAFQRELGVPHHSHYFEIREEQLQERSAPCTAISAASRPRSRCASTNHQGEDDFTIAVSISLKAFPRFKTGQDAERPLS